MRIRTFYWEDNIVPKGKRILYKWLGKQPNQHFLYGNAGDIFARELLAYLYKQHVINIPSEGGRLLSVGSIAHRALAGDILCGVGVKNKGMVPHIHEPITIYGLRGPLSLESFKHAGYNVDNLKFLYDPGLLIPYLLPEPKLSVSPTQVSFIPHYRERNLYKRNLKKEIKMIDIDNHPVTVAKQIKASKLVYSSSLHGIIFSHALGVPCIYVKPQTEESEFKFIDYYESVNLPYKKPLSSIFDADFRRDSDSPASVNVGLKDFYFPELPELQRLGIVR